MLFAAIAAFVILALLIVVIFVGLKGNRQRDLIAPPAVEDMEAMQSAARVAVLPERENMDLVAPEPVADPDANLEEAASETRMPVLGDNATEGGYSAEELMEREVRAMLLQRRPDRAVTHVMQVTGTDRETAEQMVAELADGAPS